MACRPHLARHFASRQGTDRNFYQESIDRNLDYLGSVVKTERERRLEKLKRGGVVEKVLEMQGLALKWNASPFRWMPNWPPSSTA
jgi:hypothetical protein